MSRKQWRCGHCGMAGHNTQACWVKAERRWDADEWDHAAQAAVTHDKRHSVGDLRRNVARALRAAYEAGVKRGSRLGVAMPDTAEAAE